MNSLTDQQLLRDYAGDRSEAAFAELVRRHVDFVYSAALRMVRDSHLAQDVTQGVFVALAQNVRQLTDHPVLAGWLHRTTRHLAANVVRTDVRRRAREQEAATMNELLSPEPEANWEHIAPQLDAALGELTESDRDALLLRYFKGKSAREMAEALGTTEEAAQRRVSRAVERLRELFAKRGVTVGASGLAAAIAANAVQAAPAGLAVTISTATAIAAGTTFATTTTATVAKTLAMTILQKALITATIAAAVGTGIYQTHKASVLRSQVETLQQQQGPLAAELTALQAENERLASRLAQAKEAQTLSPEQMSELLKLRGKATMGLADSRELARLKSMPAPETGKIPDYFTNAMASGLSMAEKFQRKNALARIARMTKALNLTDDQQEAVKNIMMDHIASQTQKTMDLLTGKSTPEQQLALAGSDGNQETEINALLTPAQVAAYPQYQEAELMASADSSATADVSRIAGDFNLSTAQQEKLHAQLYEMNMSPQANTVNQQAIAQAANSGNPADVTSMGITLQKSQLEAKLQILGGFLSPEQLATYRQEQMDSINSQAAAMKMFLPQKTAGTGN